MGAPRSDRARREELRLRLRAQGHPLRYIAEQMRQAPFRDRPRRAWRAARGWRQTDAVMAYRQAHPGEAMDEARWSRLENSPSPRGDRVSLEALFRIAETFGAGCTVIDLLDEADLAVMSRAERELVDSINTAHRADDVVDRSMPVPHEVGAADVAAMNTMAVAFTQTDHQVGGGHSSATVSHYLRHAVRPLLTARYDDALRQSLLIAAGRLHDIAGFTAFDAENHTVADYHFGRALRLAREAGSDALASHVLGDMAMQATHTGSAGQAVALSDGAVQHAERINSPRVMARAYALAARARAGSGDAVGTDAMVIAAERAIDRPGTQDDPPWVEFFSITQLQTEFLYAACALGRLNDVERLTGDVLIIDASMQRRHVLVGAAVARALTPNQGNGAQPERAVEILADILPTLRHLSSPRSLVSVAAARTRLDRFGAMPDLEALDLALNQKTLTS